jgi:hypothetical protein
VPAVFFIKLFQVLVGQFQILVFLQQVKQIKEVSGKLGSFLEIVNAVILIFLKVL